MGTNFDQRGNWDEQPPQMFLQGLFEESSTQKQRLGTRRALEDGREFIYCQLGAVNSVAGQPYMSAVVDAANHANLAVGANANVGEKVVKVTMGTTTLANTANALAEGYLWINTPAANGAGHTYKIKSHPAIASGAAGNIALYDKLRANIHSAASKASVLRHPCKQVLQANATLQGGIIGVAPSVYTANYFCWLQVKGPIAMEVEGTATLGASVYLSSANGTVTLGANGTSEPKYCLGTFMCNNANDHWALVNLNL